MNAKKIGGVWYDLDDLKRNCDLVAIYGNTKVHCPNPKHDDSNPSCHVYSDHVYCFSCGYHADAVTFVMHYEGLPFSAAVKLLVQHKGEKRKRVEPSTVIPETFIEDSVGELWSNDEAIAYLKWRGINEYTIRELKLGYINGKISIPHIVNGKVVNVKFRELNPETVPKYTSIAGCSFDFLYPWDFYHIIHSHSKDTGHYIMLCEGEFDAMIVLQAGMPALSLPSGANTDLWQHAAFLKKFDAVYLLFDQDAAGRRAAEKVFKSKNAIGKTLAESLQPTMTHWVSWSERWGKDVTEAREDLLPMLKRYEV